MILISLVSQRLIANIARVYKKQEKYAEALNYYSTSLNILKRLYDPDNNGKFHPDLAVTHYEISLMYEKMREYSNALTYLKASIKMLSKLKDPSYSKLLNQALAEKEKIQMIKTANSLKTQGNIHFQDFKHQKAQECYEKALSYLSKIKDVPTDIVLSLYNNLAICNLKLYKYEKALEYADRGLEIDPKIGSHFSENHKLCVG